MSEADDLRAAQHLIAQGMAAKAQPILWKLYQSENPEITLDAGLSLLAALDQLTHNGLLLQIADRCTAITSALARKDIHAFLLTQKAAFLFRELSDLLYRQQNLKLAAKVFRWIDFSLQEDKAEYAAIRDRMKQLKQEIAALEAAALAEVESNPNHYFRGKILMGLGEIAFFRFMYDLGAVVNGGRWKSKIMNLYFVRRWNLDKLIGYDRKARRKLRDSFRKGVALHKRAMEEFSAGNYRSDAGHAAYSLALKHTLTYRFSGATVYLNRAKRMANPEDDGNLFIHIAELEKMIKDRYRHRRNWVQELGLDLPRALRAQDRARRKED